MAIGIGFALPNRHAGLDGIDQLPARRERLLAMRCRRADPHGEVTGLEITRGVDGGRAHAVFGGNLLQQPASLLLRQFQIGLVVKPDH